ncbi:drug/metabolite transporter permease [Klebsiella pneumoniae]|uniref:Drug/metabolite transporter permease n=1 Tax=Klebsiella pneumoniae TaxID=573 RepID=A0A378H1S0_KLEPN|nr:drug/metabolite transporter permease [Klebsiella pneumoniae]
MLSTMAACCCSPPSGRQLFVYAHHHPGLRGVEQRFLRVLFAAIALGLLLGVQGKWSGYQGKFTSTLQLGVINSGLPFLMYCLAAQWLPAGYSATLNATAPMMGC